MPAVNVADPSLLPRIALIDSSEGIERHALEVMGAPRMLEGAGFEVRRAFAEVDLRLVDPFILLARIHRRRASG